MVFDDTKFASRFCVVWPRSHHWAITWTGIQSFCVRWRSDATKMRTAPEKCHIYAKSCNVRDPCKLRQTEEIRCWKERVGSRQTPRLRTVLASLMSGTLQVYGLSHCHCGTELRTTFVAIRIIPFYHCLTSVYYLSSVLLHNSCQWWLNPWMNRRNNLTEVSRCGRFNHAAVATATRYLVHRLNRLAHAIITRNERCQILDTDFHTSLAAFDCFYLNSHFWGASQSFGYNLTDRDRCCNLVFELSKRQRKAVRSTTGARCCGVGTDPAIIFVGCTRSRVSCSFGSSWHDFDYIWCNFAERGGGGLSLIHISEPTRPP